MKRQRLFLFMFFILDVFASSAQTLTNSALISVSPAATVRINGDLLNTAGSSITNNGVITVTGNFTNNSGTNLFGTSAGVVNMPSVNQSIGGTSVTLFNTLNLSGGTKTLLVNAQTGGNGNGVLSFQNANLVLNSKTLTHLNPAPNSIILVTSGFIKSETDPIAGYGTLTRKVQDPTGAGTYVFPFGNLSNNLSVSFDFTSGISSAGQVSVSTYPTVTTNTPNNRPLPTGVTTLMNRAGIENAANTIDRYWIMSATGFPSNPVSNITFRYSDTEWQSGTNTITESTLLPQLNNLNVWSLPMAGVINTASNTMTINGVSNYNGAWTFAGNNSPLPVELINFTADAVDNREVLCRWVTSSEINNDFFIVERSKDGFSFEAIGLVDGMGNTTAINQYHFSDKSPFSGWSYYRLRQTDFDGGVHYSEAVPVNITLQTSSVHLFPNPTSGDLNVWIDNPNGSVIPFRIIDFSGRVVSEGQIGTSGQQLLHTDDLAAGVYTLQISGGTLASVSRFVIE